MTILFFFTLCFLFVYRIVSHNLRLSHWTLDPCTFQNIFVPCCDNDYSIFKTNHHITSSDSCEVDKQNTFLTRKRNINAFITCDQAIFFFGRQKKKKKIAWSQVNAFKEVPWGLLILLKNRVLFVFRERSSWKE